MTGPWPPADLPGLRVDLGHCTAEWSPIGGAWLRIPTADYRCGCGWSTSASGDGVPLISKSIRNHNFNCPNVKDTPDGDHPERDSDPLRPAEDRP